MEVEYGYCNCGCGNKTNVASQNFKSIGIKKGEYFKFLRGHWSKLTRPWLKNGIMNMHGYRYVLVKYDHQRKESHGYVPEHVLVIENVIGKFLPVGSVPHHVNGNKSDNRNSNLVLCQDQAYHNYIHARARAFYACGNPSWRKCKFCKKYDSVDNLYCNVKSSSYSHISCKNEYSKNNKKIHKTRRREVGMTVAK